ncbi:MAG: cyclin-dependent kinase inhibitor 3 family protein [Proteobacteria bacterium]|nr:cyclin-dependent kinase inhibitor 3 family protein [Pseudomonadota bacterium]
MTLTSITNPLWIDSVAADKCNGVIGMTPCPGKKEHNAIFGDWDRDLDTDLRTIKDWGASALVSLMGKEEMAWYGIADLADKTTRLGMKHYHLPIIDMDIPDEHFDESWHRTGEKLRNYLLSGESIVIHCLGGLGRTGTIAGRLLVELGVDAETAIQRIRAARPGSIQTDIQEAYVRSCKPVITEEE